MCFPSPRRSTSETAFSEPAKSIRFNLLRRMSSSAGPSSLSIPVSRGRDSMTIVKTQCEREERSFCQISSRHPVGQGISQCLSSENGRARYPIGSSDLAPLVPPAEQLHHVLRRGDDLFDERRDIHLALAYQLLHMRDATALQSSPCRCGSPAPPSGPCQN